MYSIMAHDYIFEPDIYFKSCHASTLLPSTDEGMLSAWFAGTREGAGDVCIWFSKKDCGKWSKPIKLSEEDGIPHWNPVFHRLKNGDILLFYKVGSKISKWYTKIKVSKDDGLTWSDSVEMIHGDRGGRGPVRNKMIQLSNGWIIAPGSTEDGPWEAFVDISRDQGKSWVKFGGIRIAFITDMEDQTITSKIPVTEQSFKGRGIIQPTLWESCDGNVHMMLRSSEGYIFRSDSHDYGITWCTPYRTSLPNNNSGIDVAKLGDGRLVLAYNPVGENWGERTPLTLALSSDNGITWEKLIDLEKNSGEFSYPAILANGDEIHISYTWNRKTIAYWKIKIT